jgi:ESS family glutamate:Na+ symporter
MSAEMVGFSIILIGIMLLIGKVIRVTFSFFQTFFLPSSIIAGFIALFLGPEVLGKVINASYYRYCVDYCGLCLFGSSNDS